VQQATSDVDRLMVQLDLTDGEVAAVDELAEKVMESLRTPLQDLQAMARDEIDDQTAKELLVNGFLDMRWTSWLLGEVMADYEVFDD
jgi:hypothetical protein